jgi:hypothetical protein
VPAPSKPIQTPTPTSPAKPSVPAVKSGKG